jgi:kynureninase
MTSREDALALDRADPLGAFRERFLVDDEPRIYLDGNSLGRLPLATRARLHEAIDDWGSRIVTGWHDWIDLPRRVGDRLAGGVLGAGEGEVLVTDSTTVDLYKLAGALLPDRPGAVVVPGDEFPTDRYVLQGLAEQHGRELRLLESDPIDGPTPEEVEAALAGGDVSLLVLSHVNYRSGALADLPAVTALARAHGVPVIWDLCHAAGIVAADLSANGVELAVGCTYKYLNGGPGAPAFLYVARELQQRLRSPIGGWFAQRDQFAMGHPYVPADGIERFLAGTPPILQLAAVDESVKLTAEAGIEPARAKSVALTELIVELHDAWLEPLGFSLGSPRAPERRGAHVSLRHPDAWQICRALIERADVIPDFRGPDSIRLGVPPLYTRFVDVWDGVDRLRALVAAAEHELVDAGVSRVT